MYREDLALHESTTEAVVARDVDIVRLVDVTSDGGREIRSFRRKVKLLFDTESRMTVSHGGVEFHAGNTYTDFYGFMRSVEEATEEAEEFCRVHSVDRSSSLVVEVRTRLLATAVLADPVGSSPCGTAYRRVPDDWHVDSPQARENLDGRAKGYVYPAQEETCVSRLFPEYPEGEVVWSSRQGPTANEACIEVFRHFAEQRMAACKVA